MAALMARQPAISPKTILFQNRAPPAPPSECAEKFCAANAVHARMQAELANCPSRNADDGESVWLPAPVATRNATIESNATTAAHVFACKPGTNTSHGARLAFVSI